MERTAGGGCGDGGGGGGGGGGGDGSIRLSAARAGPVDMYKNPGGR